MSAHEIKAGDYIDVFLNEARRYLDRDDGRQRDLNKAYEFFKAAAGLGSEAAWYYLALFHRAGIGMLADENEFFSCLEQARQLEQTRLRNKRESITSQASGPLHNALGVAHMEGAGCPRNLRRASRFFKTAVLANDGQALNNLSLTVLEAVEEVRDKVQVLIDVLETVREVTPTVHRATAYDDDEWSQNESFIGGGGRHPEFESGMNNNSSSGGMPANAIEQLGKIHMLCNSLGEAAVRSMRSRAECGDYLRGMYNVAVACERGLAGPASSEDIIKTYRVVARSPGYGPAQVALAKYIFWAMVKKSDTLCEEDLTSMHCDGFRYLHRAAEANHPEAQAIYAAIYREGAFNVDPSPAEAETCFRLAVDNGWRGDGTETVQTLIAAPSDYERFMQELVPEGRQVVSRRTSCRRRMNNPHPQAPRGGSSRVTAHSSTLAARGSTSTGAQRGGGGVPAHRHYHHPSTGGRKSRAGSDLRLMAVLREEAHVSGGDDQEGVIDDSGSSSRQLSSSELPSLLALAESGSGGPNGAMRHSPGSGGTSRRCDMVTGTVGAHLQILLDDNWMRAPLTGASTTASSSITDAHSNPPNLPPRENTSASHNATPSGNVGGLSSSTKTHQRLCSSAIATRPGLDFDLATDKPPKSLAEMVSMRLPSCDLRPALSAGGISNSTIHSSEKGGDEGGGGAYRYSRRLRYTPSGPGPNPPTDTDHKLSALQEGSHQSRVPTSTSSQAQRHSPTSSDSVIEDFGGPKISGSKFHALFPASPETTLPSSGGSASRSYYATWEEEALEEGSDKSRSESLPGMSPGDSSGDTGSISRHVLPIRHRGVLRLTDLRTSIAFGPKPTPSAWLRRLKAFSLHETALHLLIAQAPLAGVLNLMTKSYCLHTLVYRREPPELHSRLTSALQKLLEASVDGLNTLQPVVVFLYRFLLYNKGTWASRAGLVGGGSGGVGAPPAAGADYRRFSDSTTPPSPTLPPLVSRCLETLNRYIDLLESSAKSTTTDAHPSSPSNKLPTPPAPLSCALWNLYLLRAMLKSRVLRYLDAADLNKAIDGCPPDRAYEVYLTYLTLMRECISPTSMPATGVPALAISNATNHDSRTMDSYINLLGKYLESAPSEELVQFSHFSGFFTSLEPSPADMQSVTSLIERWVAKRGEVEYSNQSLLPWHVEAENHHLNEESCGDSTQNPHSGPQGNLVSTKHHT